MFYCERPHPSLTPAQRKVAVPVLCRKVQLLATYILRSDRIGFTSSVQAMCESLMRYEIPPLDVLNRCVGFVLFDLRWKQETEPLTPDEQLVYEAAWELSDAIHGPRASH